MLKRKFNKLLEKSETIPIDDNSKMVFFSDCHRGIGDGSDDFAHNQLIYLAALSQYNEQKFTYVELKGFISGDVFEAIPEIEKLNHSKKPTGEYVFIDRHSKPHPDYDFIDLGALAHNVFFMLLRESITQSY